MRLSPRKKWSAAVSAEADHRPRPASHNTMLPAGGAEGAQNAHAVTVKTLVLILSVIAGSTDVIGFLGLNGLFTAHITGNLVMLAAHLIAGDVDILASLLSVPVYIVIMFLTRLIALRLARNNKPTLRPLLALQMLLLVGFLALGNAAPPAANALQGVTAGMLGVAAMAVQTALVQISLTGAPSTAVMTTNIAHFTLALADWVSGGERTRVARTRMIELLPAILGFTIGSAVGAAGEVLWGLYALVAPIGLALLTVAVAHPPSRRQAP